MSSAILNHLPEVTLGMLLGATYYVAVRVMNLLSLRYLRNAALVGVVGGFFARLATLGAIIVCLRAFSGLRVASFVISFVASYATIHLWETLARWRASRAAPPAESPRKELAHGH